MSEGRQGIYRAMAYPQKNAKDDITSEDIAKHTKKFLTRRGAVIKRLAKGESGRTDEEIREKILGKDYKSKKKKEYDSRVEEKEQDKGS